MEDSSKKCSDEARAAFQARLDGMEDRIRRRVRHAPDRLLNAYDLNDLMSSGRRRLDKAFLEGKIAEGSPEEMERLFFVTVQRIAVDQARREMRRRAAEAEAARRQASTLDVACENAADSLRQLLARLRPAERQSLDLRARGLRHEQVAEQMGMPVTTHRARWRRLLTRLRLGPARGA